MFQRLLVPWDGSELAARALDMAVEFAQTYQAEIVVISVVADAELGVPLAAEFEWARASADRAGVPIEHVVEVGRHPADALLEHAHGHGFDLIVIGHHRDAHHSALVLHGVTEHLVAAAAIPTLVVIADAATRARA